MQAVEEVVETLEGMSKTIETKEEVCQVATISANSEVEIGQLISDAMEKVGKEGVSRSERVEDSLQAGLQLSRGT